MKICFASSECTPFVKTGGLADVSSSLPDALARLGHDIKLFLPLYDSISVLDHGFVKAADLGCIPVQMGNESVPIDVWYGHLPESAVEVYLIDCPRFYNRGTVYTNDPDEADRFILLQHAAFHIMQRYAFSPDIIHANDWQTALMPAMLKYTYAWDMLFARTRSFLSIHNLAYQGLTDSSRAAKAGLPGDVAGLGDSFSLLKTGLMTADRIGTVSPTYANEILTAAFGEGLEDVLQDRSKALTGILNGIDTTAWNPATDLYLRHHFDLDDVSGKNLCKQDLCIEMNLPFKPETPLIGIVSRFAAQKGFDLLMPFLSDLLKHSGVQFVVLGSGDDHIESFFEQISVQFSDRFALYRGYNEGLAHRIEAGSDMFLMPSHYEPCGLNQMYSLRYGSVPIVRKTGGLADTVVDVDEVPGQGTGFTFLEPRPHVLRETIERALEKFSHKKAWLKMQRRGMKADFSWKISAKRYVDIYESALLSTCQT